MKGFYLFFLTPIACLFCKQGLEYTCLELPNSPYFTYITGFQAVHIIEIDPSLYEIKPVKALDDGLGRETVLSLSTRYGSVASINGGFFSIGGTFDGKACGTLKIQDWYALPMKSRGCVGWSVENQNPKMDRLFVRAKLQDQFTSYSVDGLNRPRQEGEMILFTPCFHRTTLTDPDGQELVLVDGLIQSIVNGGSTKIPDNGFIVSIEQKHPLFNHFKVGQALNVTLPIDSLTQASSAEDWGSLDYIIGGVPLLVHQGIKITDFEPEQTIPTFLSRKYARTAIGILPNGHWIFVVVDKTGFFDGMTMDELADLMANLGCVNALNLDGGGSSTMVYQGIIKNVPRGDEDEGAGQIASRRVSDAILVLPKKQL